MSHPEQTELAPAEMVLMRHPDSGGEPATTTRAAYDNLWAEKGWTLVDPGQVERAQQIVAGAVDQLEAMRADDLKAAAEVAGVDVPKGARKADVIAALKDHAEQ